MGIRENVKNGTLSIDAALGQFGVGGLTSIKLYNWLVSRKKRGGSGPKPKVYDDGLNKITRRSRKHRYANV